MNGTNCQCLETIPKQSIVIQIKKKMIQKQTQPSPTPQPTSNGSIDGEAIENKNVTKYQSIYRSKTYRGKKQENSRAATTNIPRTDMQSK